MRRGEVWLVKLGQTVGSEIMKTRPCVIVSSDNLGAHPLKVIVPLTIHCHESTALMLLNFPVVSRMVIKPSGSSCKDVPKTMVMVPSSSSTIARPAFRSATNKPSIQPKMSPAIISGSSLASAVRVSQPPKSK